MRDEQRTAAGDIVEPTHMLIADREATGLRPPTLYVQIDNCTRENKILYMFAYIEFLVAWKIFHTIDVSYLLIWHNQGNIDQVFCCTSERLCSSDAITLSDVHIQTRQRYGGLAKVSHMVSIIN